MSEGPKAGLYFPGKDDDYLNNMEPKTRLTLVKSYLTRNSQYTKEFVERVSKMHGVHKDDVNKAIAVAQYRESVDTAILTTFARDAQVRYVCSLIEQDPHIISEAYLMANEHHKAELKRMKDEHTQNVAKCAMVINNAAECSKALDDVRKVMSKVTEAGAMLITTAADTPKPAEKQNNSILTRRVVNSIGVGRGSEGRVFDDPDFDNEMLVYQCAHCNIGKYYEHNNVSRYWNEAHDAIIFLCDAHFTEHNLYQPCDAMLIK